MENDREPMDSLTDGTASLLWYHDRRRELYLLCIIGMHSYGNNQLPLSKYPDLTFYFDTVTTYLGFCLMRLPI